MSDSSFSSFSRKLTAIQRHVTESTQTRLKLVNSTLNRLGRSVARKASFKMDNATGNVFADTKLRIQDAKRAMNTTAKLVEEQARTPLHHSPSFIDKIKNWWSENVTEKFRGVSDKVKDAFTSVKDWVTDGFTNVKDAFFDIVTSIKDAIADAFKTVKDKIKTAVDAFKEKVKEGLEVVGEGLSEFKKGLTQVGKSLLDGFKDFLNIDVEDFVEMQETLASNLRGKMMDRAKQYFDDIQEEGK